MSLFKKNKIKDKHNSDVPGYGSRWLSGKGNSSKSVQRKKKSSEKLLNYPIDTSFVYYDE
jgi:hypothetical protein